MAIKTGNEGALIVISGPSGSGKGTIINQLLTEDSIELSISCTTRAPRPGETEGVSYYFKSPEEFDQMIAEGNFLEYAEVFGEKYGTPKDVVLGKLQQGKNVLLEIDVQGAMQVKNNFEQALLIFILPPTEEELLNRLRGRGTETEEQIQTRFSKAREEMSQAEHYDTRVINAEIESAVQEVREIIQQHVEIGDK